MKRVLICEGDPAVALVMTRILSQAAYDVVTTTEGADAIEHLYARDSADLLISDLMLRPPVLGIQLVDRALALRPDLPVILVTDFAHSQPKLQSGKLRNVTVINKPVTAPMLLKAVSAVFGPGAAGAVRT